MSDHLFGEKGNLPDYAPPEPPEEDSAARWREAHARAAAATGDPGLTILVNPGHGYTNAPVVHDVVLNAINRQAAVLASLYENRFGSGLPSVIERE